MKVTISKTKSILVLLGLTLVCAFGFQNCSSEIQFAKGEPTIVDAVCAAPGGCMSAATDTTNSQGTQTPTAPSTQTPINNGGGNNGNVNGGGNVAASPSLLYNFVAGDKQTCEASIVSRIGRSVACTISGGCGLSCGKPGGNCQTANPGLWGACVDINDPVAPPVVSNQVFNFVAGDKQTCENSIASRLGVAAACSIGGGCGLSCGAPRGNCVSANPSLWGACLDQNGQVL